MQFNLGVTMTRLNIAIDDTGKLDRIRLVVFRHGYNRSERLRNRHKDHYATDDIRGWDDFKHTKVCARKRHAVAHICSGSGYVHL